MTFRIRHSLLCQTIYHVTSSSRRNDASCNVAHRGGGGEGGIAGDGGGGRDGIGGGRINGSLEGLDYVIPWFSVKLTEEK